MKKENTSEEFTIEVYACNGGVSQYGYDNYNKGMVFFNYGNASVSLRGDSRLLAKTLASDLEESLRKNSGIKVIRFDFPDDSTSVPITVDGFFGRPTLYVGAIFLKPLQERRKTVLVREINKISNITDKRGNLIKLVAQ